MIMIVTLGYSRCSNWKR